jgi:CubicO group peptidase (beta-lactamase class C family)
LGQVHASGPGLALSFNHGRLRMNDSSSTQNVTSDSIFRLASVSKNLAAFSTLVLQNVSRSMAAGDPSIQPLSLDTPVRTVLPSFSLPEEDWLNGGSEITIAQLGSHSSGLTREGYSTDFNMVTALGRANASYIGAEWASVTPGQVLKYLSKRNLMFAPGQRAAYSNAGFAVLGAAVSSYRNDLMGTSDPWADYVQKDIFGPLGMTRSFFGPPSPDIRDQLAIPGVNNWVDLVVDGYNPAGGMWSSASDLASYIYQVWLSPNPRLITPNQRRQSLQPRISLPDGKQQVGFGWEIPLRTGRNNKTYNVYGKSGDAAGNHAWIDVIPNLGYGLVVLSQESGEAHKTMIRPSSVRDSVHEILIPAFETALSNLMTRRFAGHYTLAFDSGLIPDELATTQPEDASRHVAQSYALIEVQSGSMFLRALIVNGTNALEGIDKLGWAANATSHSRFFSVPGVGSGLNPSEALGDAAHLAGGEGLTIWQTIPELDECDWFDFGGYTDQNGWPLSQVALVEKDGGGVELHYPPFDIMLMRPEPVHRRNEGHMYMTRQCLVACS